MGQGPGRRPGRRGRTALGGPRTPPCGPSSPQHPLGSAGKLKTALRASGSQKGGGRPREARGRRKTQKQTSPAAGAKPPLRMPLGGPWNPGELFSGPGRSQRTVGPRKRLEKASGADAGETGETGSGPDRRSGRRPGARRPRKSQGGGRRAGGLTPDVRRPEGPGRGGGKPPEIRGKKAELHENGGYE